MRRACVTCYDGGNYTTIRFYNARQTLSVCKIGLASMDWYQQLAFSTEF